MHPAESLYQESISILNEELSRWSSYGVASISNLVPDMDVGIHPCRNSSQQQFSSINNTSLPDRYARHAFTSHNMAQLYRSINDHDRSTSYFQEALNSIDESRSALNVHPG
jgi:hypothetical protein